MSEHTKGKWKAEDGMIGDSIKVSSMNDEDICWCEPIYGQEIANARLIAAAPELLEACKLALKSDYLSSGIDKVIKHAIAKAEGK